MIIWRNTTVPRLMLTPLVVGENLMLNMAISSVSLVGKANPGGTKFANVSANSGSRKVQCVQRTL